MYIVTHTTSLSISKNAWGGGEWLFKKQCCFSFTKTEMDFSKAPILLVIKTKTNINAALVC